MKLLKKLYPILVMALLMMLFGACEKEAAIPTLSVTATPSTVSAGETVTFEITGEAQTFAIFTGDAGHRYDSSYLVLAEGKEVDLELVVLTQDSLNSLLPWLELKVDTFNMQAQMNNMDPLVFAEVQSALVALVGVEFEYYEAARYKIATEILPGLEAVAVDLVDNYFEDRSTILAPPGGFHTGVALDRYDLGYTYVYNQPGQYTATVIATNVSFKNYSGAGYQNDRTASASEYDVDRVISEVTITVQ